MAGAWDRVPAEIRRNAWAPLVLKPATLLQEIDHLPQGVDRDEARCRLAMLLILDDDLLWDAMRMEAFPGLVRQEKHLWDQDKPNPGPWRFLFTSDYW